MIENTKDENETSPTEAKVVVSLLLTIHALLTVFLIRWDYARDHFVPFTFGLVVWTVFIMGLMRHYVTLAFPKE